MSEWRKVQKEDIYYDLYSKEMEIWVMDNHNGNVYITLTLEQLEEAVKRLR